MPAPWPLLCSSSPAYNERPPDLSLGSAYSAQSQHSLQGVASFTIKFTWFSHHGFSASHHKTPSPKHVESTLGVKTCHTSYTESAGIKGVPPAERNALFSLGLHRSKYLPKTKLRCQTSHVTYTRTLKSNQEMFYWVSSLQCSNVITFRPFSSNDRDPLQG